MLTSLGRPRPVDLDRIDVSSFATEIESGDRGVIEAVVGGIQRAMSQHVAVVRSAEGLRAAAADVARLTGVLEAAGGNDRVAIEAHNIAEAASQVIAAALFRKESRGAHFRDDFPDKDAEFGKVNLVLRPGPDGEMGLRRQPLPDMPAELKQVIEEMK